MIRILALNEESHSSGSEDDDAPTVTKEAQVTKNSFQLNDALEVRPTKFICFVYQ